MLTAAAFSDVFLNLISSGCTVVETGVNYLLEFRLIFCYQHIY